MSERKVRHGLCPCSTLVSPDGILGRCITHELQAALQQVHGDASYRQVKVESGTRSVEWYGKRVYLGVWVVSW